MKKIAIAVALCMVSSIIVGGVALAAAQRLPLYPVAGGSSDNVLTDEPSKGRVVLVNPKGDVTLIIQGNVEGLKDNYLYTVWVRNLDLHGGYTGSCIVYYKPLGYYLLSTFTANSKGKGHFHLNIRAADLPAGMYDIQVAINDPGDDPAFIGVTVLATVMYTVVSVGS